MYIVCMQPELLAESHRRTKPSSLPVTKLSPHTLYFIEDMASVCALNAEMHEPEVESNVITLPSYPPVSIVRFTGFDVTQYT